MTVVFLAGILVGKDCFAPTERLFKAAGFDTYAHSFPGYDGIERLPQETPSPEDYADDLRKKIDGLGAVHLVAHCSGCAPALAFALKYPAQVLSLTLVSYWHGTKEWKSREAILVEGVEGYASKRVSQLISNTDDETVERVIGWMCAAITDTEGFFQMARSINRYHAKETLALVKVPLHFVVGDADAITLPDAQISIARKKGAELTVIQGGSHCMFFDSPAPVAKSVLGFIAGITL